MWTAGSVAGTGPSRSLPLRLSLSEPRGFGPSFKENAMISRTRQNWEPGQSVKVGFLTLTVVQCIPTPGDYAPDAYILINSGQNQLYKFVPHNGLTKLSLTDA